MPSVLLVGSSAGDTTTGEPTGSSLKRPPDWLLQTFRLETAAGSDASIVSQGRVTSFDVRGGRTGPICLPAFSGELLLIDGRSRRVCVPRARAACYSPAVELVVSLFFEGGRAAVVRGQRRWDGAPDASQASRMGPASRCPISMSWSNLSKSSRPTPASAGRI